MVRDDETGRTMNIAEYATGLQHVGIPTRALEETVAFYTQLGFRRIYQTENAGTSVVFLQLRDLMVEIWTGASVGAAGAIDHIAIAVTDIDEVFRIISRSGVPIIEGEVRQLPFWDHGVRYFTVAGPNAEKVEFIQVLK